MQAAYLTNFGGPEVFAVGEVATPEPQSHEVRVRVNAVGLNYYDALLRQGAVSQDIPLPHIPGSDMVGTVDAVGEEVQHYLVGDKVIVAPGFPVDSGDWDRAPVNYTPSYYPGGTFNHGGYGQYMTIHERWLLKNDFNMPDEELATIPLVLTTAMHAVKTLGQVGPGTNVLVQAGASGSGSMAIQVAKALGARVATTVSNQRKGELARQLGADEVINYKNDNFADVAREWTQGQGVDVVIDNVGGSIMHDNIRATRWGGKIVNFGLVGGLEAVIPNMYEFFRGQFQFLGCFMGTMDELAEGLQLLRDCKIKAAIDEVMPLDKVVEAHQRIDQHQVAGKLVLQPWA